MGAYGKHSGYPALYGALLPFFGVAGCLGSAL